MDSRALPLIAASLLLANCSPKKAENTPLAPPPEPAPVSAAAAAPSTPAATNTLPAAEAPAPTPPPAAQPDTPTPASEVTPDTAAGIAREYFALIGARQYPMALALWGSSAPAKTDLARQYDKYTTFNATVGAPGEQQGAAGSSYIEIPVKTSAKLKSGGTEKLAGTIVLRRVNDVPGSTAADRHWHIYSVNLKPA